MSQHEGIIVATDETDHIAFICPKCDKPMAVSRVTNSPMDSTIGLPRVTHIWLKCPGCGHDHWRKFDWNGGTATICKHRTDALTQSREGAKGDARPPFPVVMGSPISRDEIIESLRENYQAMLRLEQERDSTLAGYPDMVTVLDYIEQHGLPPKGGQS